MLFNSGQLKVMIVGGPNQRNDYHIEKGAELFYQIRGDMDLDIMEDGTKKRVHISEGTMMLLPPGVPHSPQRYADTVGIVIERERLEGEQDCLRWYVPGTNSILFESFFHCVDLGTQVKAAIEEYNSKVAATSNDKKPDGKPDYYPFDKPQKSSTFPTIKLSRRIRSVLETIEAETTTAKAKAAAADAGTISNSGIEEPVPVVTPFSLIKGEFNVDLLHSNHRSTSFTLPVNAEALLWQQQGRSEIKALTKKEGNPTPVQLASGEVALLTSNDVDQVIKVKQLERAGSTLCITNVVIKKPTQ
jgi:3-hydroxyanthranilate 3,4-dioxygenase